MEDLEQQMPDLTLKDEEQVYILTAVFGTMLHFALLSMGLGYQYLLYHGRKVKGIVGRNSCSF